MSGAAISGYFLLCSFYALEVLFLLYILQKTHPKKLPGHSPPPPCLHPPGPPPRRSFWATWLDPAWLDLTLPHTLSSLQPFFCCRLTPWYTFLSIFSLVFFLWSVLLCWCFQFSTKIPFRCWLYTLGISVCLPPVRSSTAPVFLSPWSSLLVVLFQWVFFFHWYFFHLLMVYSLFQWSFFVF